MKNRSAIYKLKMDIRRYRSDYNLTRPLGSLMLVFVVDFWPILHFRMQEYASGASFLVSRLLKAVLLLMKPVVEGFSGARIYSSAVIGGGMLLHQSSGVVIAPGVVIGKNCTFFSGVCLVHKANDAGEPAPVIGDNVKLMVGCKVIGNVRVGDNAHVGANSVVIHDVPDNSIAVGIPARIINKKDADITE